MAADVLVGWHGFQEVFPAHWEGGKQCRPRDATPSSDDLVDEMRRWGHPEQMGDIAYRCLPCGQGNHLVSLSCQSALCWRCAKVDGDDWVAPVGNMLQEGVLSRHRVLTVPEV